MAKSEAVKALEDIVHLVDQVRTPGEAELALGRVREIASRTLAASKSKKKSTKKKAKEGESDGSG